MHTKNKAQAEHQEPRASAIQEERKKKMREDKMQDETNPNSETAKR